MFFISASLLLRLWKIIAPFAENTERIMKASLCPLLAFSILLASACERDELSRPRSECYSRASREVPVPSKPILQPKADTTLYYCAVDFDPSYDWIRDTAYGAVAYSLNLYRQHAKVLSIPSSSGLISPDADTHHIIGEHLYTERSYLGSTIVACDGVELFRFEGREMLKGILPHEGHIYTLSQSRSGSGFSFRMDGEPLLRRPNGTLFGDLCDSSYGNTGALYLDDESICFSYRDGDKTYCVVDGEQTAIPLGDYQDVKRIASQVYRVSSPYCGRYVSGARLWRLDQVGVSAFFENEQQAYTAFYKSLESNSYELICYNEAALYLSQKHRALVYKDQYKYSYIAGSPLWQYKIEEEYTLMSPKCAVLCGDTFCAAFSPYHIGSLPIIICNKELHTLSVNGFVSDIELAVGFT